MRKVLIKKEELGLYFLLGNSFTPVHISQPPEWSDLRTEERWGEHVCSAIKKSYCM